MIGQAPFLIGSTNELKGMDLPMQRNADASAIGLADLDSEMRGFAARHGRTLDRALLRQLKPKLRSIAATRHNSAGYAAATYLCESSSQAAARAPSAQWPDSVLPLLRDGHAVGFFIYPDLPTLDQLHQIREAVRTAKKYGRGIWSHRPPLLQPCEYRWITDVITGRSDGPELYCGNFIDHRLCLPQQYFLVAEEDRVWFRPGDVGAAMKLGYRLR